MRNGLFVEHFQNEMPYDPPSQSAWMSSPSTDGYAAFLLTPGIQSVINGVGGSSTAANADTPVDVVSYP